jgi:hypothetical protein
MSRNIDHVARLGKRWSEHPILAQFKNFRKNRVKKYYKSILYRCSVFVVLPLHKQMFWVYFPHFEKANVGLRDHHAVCVSVHPPYKLLNGWTNIYEIWYVYHGTWAHLNGYFINLNKEFWEQLIAYFPWYDTDCIENDASNNSSILACAFVAAETCLLRCCLATIGEIQI